MSHNSKNHRDGRPQSADGTRFILPHIVLRDPAGLPLDTYTSFQRDIEESRQRLAEVRTGGLATSRLGPSEWRLPHAPVPARPDYTSAFDPLITKRQRMALKRTLGQEPSELVVALDIDHDAAARRLKKTASSDRQHWQLLYHLAETVIGPMASNLAPLLPPPSTSCPSFLPFIAAVPLSSELELNSGNGQRHQPRDAKYFNANGRHHECYDSLCGGCRRERIGFTFCYGCERDSQPHYHHDKTARTGGGFTYIKRDRPLHAIKRNNPLNWRVVLDNGQVVYVDDLDEREITKSSENVIGDTNNTRETVSLDDAVLFRLEVDVSDFELRAKTTTPALAYNNEIEDALVENDEDEEWNEEEEVEVEERDEFCDSGHEVTDIDEFEIEGTDNEGTDNIGELSKGDDGNDQSETVRQRKRLYQAPKAFELKKRDKKFTDASLPFRTDRDLNLPKYGSIEIHKSDKKLTEFVSVNRGDSSWQAPDAFVLHEREDLPDNWRLAERPSVETNVAHHLPPQTVLPQQQPTQQQVKKSPKPSVKQEEKTQKVRPVKTRPLVEPAITPDSGVGSVSLPAPVAASSLPAIVPEIIPSQVNSPELSSITSSTNDDISPVSVVVSPESAVSPELIPEQTVVVTIPKVATAVEPAKVEQPVVGPRPPTKPQPKAEQQPRRRPKAKEPVKKDRKQETNKRVKSKNEELPNEPEHEKREPEPAGDVALTPEPPFEPMTFKEHTIPIVIPSKHVEHPPLPTASPPSLPRVIDVIEPVKPIREISSTQLEVPPPMMEPPKQRRPPPALKLKSKPRRLARPATMRSVGAPVQATDMKNIGDPLDFLAKYCIIHPDRLPHYVRVFSKSVNEQMYRYSDVPHPEGQYIDDDSEAVEPVTDTTIPDTSEERPPDVHENCDTVKTTLTEAEEKKIKQFSVVNVSLKPQYAMVGMNEGDQTLAKINYTLDALMNKYEALRDKLDNVANTHVHSLASLARKQFPQIADPQYKPPKEKKKNKKKRKGKTEDTPMADNPGECEKMANAEKSANEFPQKLSKPSDIDIINRLDDKQLKILNADTDLSRLNLELQRLQEKVHEIDSRIEELEDEKKLLQLYARDEFQRLETAGVKPEQFMRQQSALYQRMHPCVNVEMNVMDIEEALQEINGHLITKKEIQYVFHILQIPGRKRVDIQLFSVIAALSEKVAQVDPFIRKLINKFDYEALNTKMDRSKELFRLLNENETDVPLGKIAARMLAVELAAGGVTPEHAKFVLSKFNRENKGVVDFLDFLTYVPLFIEIHDRILKAPLQLDRDW